MKKQKSIYLEIYGLDNMICSICKREGESVYFEKHHLIPQTNSNTINVCRQCGDQLHLMFDNGTLKRELNNIDKILSNELMIKYIKWVRKKPIESHFSVAKKKRKK